MKNRYYKFSCKSTFLKLFVIVEGVWEDSKLLLILFTDRYWIICIIKFVCFMIHWIPTYTGAYLYLIYDWLEIYALSPPPPKGFCSVTVIEKYWLKDVEAHNQSQQVVGVLAVQSCRNELVTVALDDVRVAWEWQLEPIVEARETDRNNNNSNSNDGKMVTFTRNSNP